MKILFIIALLSAYSCSSTSSKSITTSSKKANDRNKKLLKDFSVEDDVMSKFAAKEGEENDSKASLPKAIEQRKRVEKKSATTKKSSDISKKIVKLKPTKTSETIYRSSDYPSEFIKSDKKSEKFWNKIQPIIFPGEKSVFSIKYGGISTGTIILETKNNTFIGDEEAYHFRARVKTSSYYSYLYEVDDICDSYVETKNFLPLKFSLIQRESSQDIDDLQLFDHGKLKVYTFYKRKTKDKERKKQRKKFVPKYFQDPLSVMHLIRSLPMTIGANYSVPIINKGKTEILKASIVGIDNIDTKLGEKEAYRVEVLSHHEGKTIESGKMTFWYTTSADRVFLEFKAKIKLGSITGEILEYSK